MSSKQTFILAALSLLGMFLLFALGSVFLSLFFLEHIRVQSVNILMAKSPYLLMVGSLFVGLGAVLSLALLYLFKGKRLHVQLKSGSMFISKSIVEKAVFSFWESEVCETLPHVAILKSNAIEIHCPLSLKERIESMENAMCCHIESQLGIAPKMNFIFCT